MSSDDFYKKHLEETGLADAGSKRVLEALRKNPRVMNRAEPPAGYEGELLAALRRQLPLEKKAPQAAPKKRSSFSLLRSPAFAWSLSGVFALAAFITVTNFRGESGSSQGDLLAQTARKGSAEAVGDWMASMGDTSIQRRVAMADIESAARDLASAKDRKVVEDVLEDVARTMGMK